MSSTTNNPTTNITTTTNHNNPTSSCSSSSFETRLLSKFRSTLSTLEVAWKQVGLSPREQTEEVEVLIKELEVIFQRKIETESALAQEYEKEVLKLKEDITIVAQRLELGQVQPPVTEVPLSERQPLVKELTWLRGQWEKLDAQRLSLETAAEKKLLELHTIWGELGMKPEPGYEEVGFILNQKRYEMFESKLKLVMVERAKRVEEIRNKAHLTLELMELLQVDISLHEFDRAIASCDERIIGLSNEVLRSIELRYKELEVEKNKNLQLLQNLGRKIQPLWDLLGVLPHERQAFFDKNSGCSQQVVQACEEEVTRLMKIKRDRFGDFISAIRVKILEALDERRASASERARLAPLLSQTISPDDLEANEELLQKHEIELQRLLEIVEEIRPIVTTSRKYLDLCLERTNYEKLMADSSRLLNRKPGAMLHLQQEEILRKHVTQDLPKIVIALKKLIVEFEKKYQFGQKLILNDVFGEDTPVLDVIQRNEQEHDENIAREKESKLKEKGGGSSNISTIGVGVVGVGKKVPMATNNNNSSSNGRIPPPIPSSQQQQQQQHQHQQGQKVPFGIVKAKN
jgi:hypothetical protein